MTKSLFIKALGDYPMMRVLDFLLENRVFDYSKSEMAENSGISRTTLNGLWERLLKDGIIKKTREIGRAVMYRFNPESEISKKLIDLDFAVSKQFAENADSSIKVAVPV